MGNKTHRSKIGLIGVAVLLIALLSGCISNGDPRLGASASTVTPTATNTPSAASGVAATVGDQTISMADFQMNVRFQRYQLISQFTQYYQYYSQYPGDPFGLRTQLDQLSSTLTQPTVMGGNVLDHMIEDIMIAKEAAKRGITVTDDEVNTAYQQIFGYFANGTPTPTIEPTAVAKSTLNPTQLAIVTVTPTVPVIPTETPGPTATLDPSATPAPSPTPYTAEGFKTVTTNFYTSMQSINITEPFIMSLLRTQLLGEKLSVAIGKDVPTTKDQVWARHILVADEATAQTVLTRLKNGEDFAAIAKELSTDTGTKDSGGDLGWFAQGTMVAEFDTAVFAMKVGEISQPVKTSFGYHVIQLLGHEVRPLSVSDLASAKSAAFNTWIQAQLTDPSIVRNDAWMQNIPSIPAFTAPNLDATTPTP